MSGFIEIVIDGAAQAEARLAAAGLAIEGQKLLLTLAELGKNQTQRRLETEKTGPDGTAWPKTRDGRAALFVDGSHISANIQSAVEGHTAKWGISKAAFPGAMAHQFGATIVPVNVKVLVWGPEGARVHAKKVVIPARPYLGISADNTTEIERTTLRFLSLVLQ